MATTTPTATSAASPTPPRRWYREPGNVLPLAAILLGLAILVGVPAPGGRFTTDVIVPRGTRFSWEYAASIVPDIARGLYTTVRVTAMAAMIMFSLGLVLALLRRARLRVVRWPAALTIEFIRSTPILVQFIFGLAIVRAIPGVSLSGIQIAFIVLGIHYATYASEAYRAGIDSVPGGQWEAATALNLSPATTWTRLIIPQAVPNILPTLGNYLIAALKDAPIAGPVLGVPGIMFAANTLRADTFRQPEPFIVAGVGFLLVSIPAAWLVRRLEKRVAYERD